jgi:hypothetical protein
MPELLHQDEVWIDREGRTHSLDHMTTRYLRNLRAFLMRRAKGFLDWEIDEMVYGPQPHGDAARDAFEAELDWALRADPQEWLAETELVRAIDEILLEREVGF